MSTEKQEGKSTTFGTLAAVQNEAPIESPAEKKTCRIFVSRKTSDASVFENRKKLCAYALGNLEIFDAEDIVAGTDWRNAIRSGLTQADILLLVVTRPAQNDYDWLLYEAGLFDMLPGKRKLICIYPQGTEPPEQLNDTQGCEATAENIHNLLIQIYTDKDFTFTCAALNADAPVDFKDEIATIAKEIALDVSGKTSNTYVESYANPYLRLVLPVGATALEMETQIESDERTLRSLFGLQEVPTDSARSYWTWGDIEKAVDLGTDDQGHFNLHWTREIVQWIEGLIGGQASQQIRSRFIAKDKQIWRPEIEVLRCYESGMRSVNITFSPQQQEQWLSKAKPPIALAANLNLAVRVRHELIEPYLRLLSRSRGKDNTSNFSRLGALILTIEREGFFIRWLTSDVMIDIFDLEDTEKIDELEKDFGENIYQSLHASVDANNVDDTISALKLWHDNNLEFLRIGMPRYMNLLGLGD